MGKRLGRSSAFYGLFWNADPDSIDCVDSDELEAHRMRAQSQPKVPGPLRPKISQVEELIRAAKVTIFFVDENQIISPFEVGEPAIIRETAQRLRCSLPRVQVGESVSLQWIRCLSCVAGRCIRTRWPIARTRARDASTGFDFKLVDLPHKLVDEIRQKNLQNPNSARLLAGWSWPWSHPLPDSLVDESLSVISVSPGS